MLVMGLIFLVVGIAMAAFGLLDAGPGGMGSLLGLGLTGFIFAVVGLILLPIGIVMLRNKSRDERIRREGIAGSATITDIAETNMTINDRPVLGLSLNVTVPGRSPYAVQKRITMPWNAMGRIAVGATVPVMVDPNDPDDIVIDWVSAPVYGGGMPGVVAATPMAAAPLVSASATTATTPGQPVPNQLSAPGVVPMTGAQAGQAGGEALLQYLRSMGIDINGPMAAIDHVGRSHPVDSGPDVDDAADVDARPGPGRAAPAGTAGVPGAAGAPGTRRHRAARRARR